MNYDMFTMPDFASYDEAFSYWIKLFEGTIGEKYPKDSEETKSVVYNLTLMTKYLSNAKAEGISLVANGGVDMVVGTLLTITQMYDDGIGARIKDPASFYAFLYEEFCNAEGRYGKHADTLIVVINFAPVIAKRIKSILETDNEEKTDNTD